MKVEKFEELWNNSCENWLKSEIEIDSNKKIAVSDVCSISRDSAKKVYTQYIAIKTAAKKLYFKDEQKTLSRYKRAAALAYAVILANPLEYKMPTSERFDHVSYFLKQRFAFYFALSSIILDYKQEYIAELIDKSGHIFEFDALGDVNDSDCDDTFLESVYKDMFFSELYQNYNILTMANVFGLLVERASHLKKSGLVSASKK